MRRPSSSRWLLAPLALLVAGLLVSCLWTPLAATRFTAPEQWLHDRLTGWWLARTGTIDRRITVVDIDEASLSELGRWPWPRETVGRLFTRLLSHYDVALVGSDILLVDPAPGERLPGIMADARVVHPVVWSEDTAERKGLFAGGETPAVVVLPGGTAAVASRPGGARAAPQAGARADSPTGPQAPVLPPPALIPAARGWLGLPPDGPALAAAHVTPLVDSDGTVRSMAPLACSDTGACVESLALSLYRRLLGLPPVYRLQDAALYLGEAEPTPPLAWLNHRGHAWLPWTGYASDAVYVSAVDVLNQRTPRERLTGQVVLVGSTALGLHDQISTPFAAVYPSLEVHRNSLSALLDGRADRTLHAARVWETAAAAVLLALMWALCTRATPALAMGLGAVAVLLWLGAVVWARHRGVYLPFAVLPATYMAYTVALALVLYPREAQRSRQQLIRRLGAYVAPQVLERLRQDPDTPLMQTHQRCTMTVLFADVRGYTRYSETVSPTELARVTRILMNALTQVVLRHDGTIDKYMGDNVMAFWGAPLLSADQAERAVTAAADMIETIRRLNESGELPGFRIGIGINTGEAVVGDMGSDFRYDYTVIGASVNVASYFETGTRDSPWNLIIGPRTYEQSETARRLPAQTVNVQAKGLQYEGRAYAL